MSNRVSIVIAGALIGLGISLQPMVEEFLVKPAHAQNVVQVDTKMSELIEQYFTLRKTHMETLIAIFNRIETHTRNIDQNSAEIKESAASFLSREK